MTAIELDSPCRFQASLNVLQNLTNGLFSYSLRYSERLNKSGLPRNLSPPFYGQTRWNIDKWKLFTIVQKESNRLCVGDKTHAKHLSHQLVIKFISFHMLKTFLLSVIVVIVLLLLMVLMSSIIKFVAVDRFQLFWRYTQVFRMDLAGSNHHQLATNSQIWNYRWADWIRLNQIDCKWNSVRRDIKQFLKCWMNEWTR